MLELRLTQATSCGGSVDSEHTAVAVMPNRSPVGLAAATTHTVAASELIAVCRARITRAEDDVSNIVTALDDFDPADE